MPQVTNGLKAVLDINSAPRGSSPVGRGQTNQRRGRRASSARAYLGRARARRNLVVRTHALVERVRVENGRATGVDFAWHGRIRHVAADAEVIVAAGTFGSPKLLMLSGIGPAEALRATGVEPVVDLPGVGRNLMDHPMVVIRPEILTPTYNSLVTKPAYAKAALEWLFNGSGLATVTLGHAVGYARSDPSQAVPDLFLAFSPLAYDVGETRVNFPREPRVTLCVGLCRPFGRGRVSLRSPQPGDPPRIALSYLADERDRALLTRGYRLLEDILLAPPMKDLLAAPLERRIPDLASETFSMYHPCGTCRMGPVGAAETVVDGRLRVQGVAGLRVVDASVMPLITSGNLHAPVIMLAEKAAQMIRDDRA